MSAALAYAQPEPSYDPVAIGASRAFHGSLARQNAPDALTVAMDNTLAAIDAMVARHEAIARRNAALSAEAVAIADAEVGPRSTGAVKSPLTDPQGFVARCQHGAAWNAVYRREARRLFGSAQA